MNYITLTLVEETQIMKAMEANEKSLNEKSVRIQEACRRDRIAHLQNVYE